MRWTDPSIVAADDRPRRDPGPELLVAPVRVGRQRSADALALAAAIAVVLGAALLKPWSSLPASSASPAPQAVAAASAAPSLPVARSARTPDPAALVLIRTATRASRVADWSRLAGDLDHLARQPIVSDRDLGGTDGDGTCGGSARITPFDEVLGLVGPPGERVADIRLFAIDSISHPDLPVRIRSDRPGPLDGRSGDPVTIVDLPAGGLAPREYALIAEVRGSIGDRRLTYTICVG